jgi:hypothetical protein
VSLRDRRSLPVEAISSYASWRLLREERFASQSDSDTPKLKYTLGEIKR